MSDPTDTPTPPAQDPVDAAGDKAAQDALEFFRSALMSVEHPLNIFTDINTCTAAVRVVSDLMAIDKAARDQGYSLVDVIEHLTSRALGISVDTRPKTTEPVKAA